VKSIIEVSVVQLVVLSSYFISLNGDKHFALAQASGI